MFPLGEKLKRGVGKCVELFEAFIRNLQLLLDSSRKANRLMNVGFAEQYHAGLDGLLGFLRASKAAFQGTFRALEDKFLRLLEFQCRDSQKLLNVGPDC